MKTNKEQIDDIIRQALTEEEARFYDELDEQNLLQMVGGLFQGKLKWLLVLINMVMVVAFALFIYCIVQFFNATETMELIKWSAAGLLCIAIVSFLKLFQWMQIDKNDILRELKRLELQISSISHKISN